MKSRLLRIENLLIILPLGMPALSIYNMTGPSKYEEYFFGRETQLRSFLFSLFFEQLIVWTFILLPAFLMHYFLRIIRKRNRVVCFVHVIVTALAILYWNIFANFATSVVPGWHTTVYAPMFSGSITGFPFGVNLFFWLLQLSFIIYGLTVIRRWKTS
ncbi:MAG: hypothetical protein WCF67_06675 [Chitinophagaceae bacterium]